MERKKKIKKTGMVPKRHSDGDLGMCKKMALVFLGLIGLH